MESRKQAGASSSSSFTLELFGPKDTSSSSSSTASGLFGSVFGPPPTGLGKDSCYSGFMGSSKKQDMASQSGSSKHGIPPDNTTHRGKGESHNAKEKMGSKYQDDQTVEPCYLSSSIYYGGQEVYSPISQPTSPQHILDKFKRDERDDDANGSSASRGNWWQGSLYY